MNEGIFTATVMNRAESVKSQQIDRQEPRDYRPDIDGLRAVSVLAVVAFHAFPRLVPGGFVGVDVFFVISGFLISGIIFDEMHCDAFNLRNFYARRIRRIFPALVLVLAVTAFSGWWVLLPSDFLRLGKQLLSSAAFASNFYFWLQSGYFSPDAHTFPLLHLWSLGVEEQFYIVWPLVIMSLRNGPSWLFRAILTFAICSFLLNVLLVDRHELDFYSPLTRAWELMLGAAVAWSIRHHSAALSVSRIELARVTGLAAVLAAMFFLDGEFGYPGWLALLPTLGTTALLWGAPRGPTTRLLSTKPMVYVGRVSYPFYLWHWPILVLAEAFKFGPLTELERFLVIVASFVLASLTYEFVEKPVRFRPSGRSIRALCGGMVAIAFAGITIIHAGGFETRFPPEIRAVAEPHDAPREWRVHECLLELAKETSFAESCIESERPLLLVWGDSTATALMPGLRKRQQELHFGLAQLTSSGCPPRLRVDVPGNPNCKSVNDTVLNMIARAKPDIVLLQSRGDLSTDQEMPGLKETIVALRELSVPRIVLLGPTPVWKRTLPGEVVNYFVKHHSSIPQRYSNGVYQKWDDRRMRSFANQLGADYISIWEALCNDEGCLTRLSDAPNDLVISDQHHLTSRGSIFLVDKIWDGIWPASLQHSTSPVSEPPHPSDVSR